MRNSLQSNEICEASVHTAVCRGAPVALGAVRVVWAAELRALLAYERKGGAAMIWTRANTWSAESGITVRNALTDNESCYPSPPFSSPLGRIPHPPTRP